MDFSRLFTVVVLPACFFSVVPLQSIDCFCSYRQLIASVCRHYCSCSSSRPFRFSPSIVSALLVARSASVHRLFLLFSSINSFSSRQFHSSPSIVSALLVARSASVHRLFTLFSSINCFSSRQFCSSPSISSALLIVDLGGVRLENDA